MCRLCSYYTKIDLTQLPTSNPFFDDIVTPTSVEIEDGLEVPNTIVVESPESSRHTAWTNPQRFPSLHRTRMSLGLPSPPPTTVSSPPQSTSRSISIYGPQELSKVNQHPYNTFDPQDRQRDTLPFQPANFSASLRRKLQHHDQVNSYPRVVTEDTISEVSSQGDTPRNLSPVSDDEEFAYLPLALEVLVARSRGAVPARKPVNYEFYSASAVSERLKLNEYKAPATARWM